MKFSCFGLQKWSQNQQGLTTFSKTSILQKSLFFLREIDVFLVSSLQKSRQNRYKNALQNNIEKKGSKI